VDSFVVDILHNNFILESIDRKEESNTLETNWANIKHKQQIKCCTNFDIVVGQCPTKKN
jgi:hypothetical protein